MSETSVHTAGMFDGQPAWFSSSVQQHYKDAWGEEGGLTVDFGEALYIFSEDATAADTKSIYESKKYLTNWISVFHPKYIKECLDIGDPKQVTIGKFFMPPEDVQKVIKWDINLITGITGSPKRRRSAHHSMTSHSVSRFHSNTSQNVRVLQPYSVATQTMQVNELPKVSVMPKNPEVSVSFSRNTQHSVIGYVTHAARRRDICQNSDNDTSRQCVSYFVVEGYQPVECLSSYSGPLDDFVLGKNGCHVTNN